MIYLCWPADDAGCPLYVAGAWRPGQAKTVVLSVPYNIVSSRPSPSCFTCDISYRCPAACAQFQLLVDAVDKIFTGFP